MIRLAPGALWKEFAKTPKLIEARSRDHPQPIRKEYTVNQKRAHREKEAHKARQGGGEADYEGPLCPRGKLSTQRKVSFYPRESQSPKREPPKCFCPQTGLPSPQIYRSGPLSRQRLQGGHPIFCLFRQCHPPEGLSHHSRSAEPQGEASAAICVFRPEEKFGFRKKLRYLRKIFEMDRARAVRHPS